MKIHEILDRDPRTANLVNNGQARILDQPDDSDRSELRWEAETFVCDGQFGRALQRILERYLANLGAPRQEAAWISGFFGSGKSHLLKMLSHLWTDTPFTDGSTTRSLVRELPDDVRSHLRELDTHARRSGKPAVAAAGTLLGGNEYVRHTVLSILLRACGWPSHYPQARFCFWLREQGMLDTVRAAVEAEGKDWLRELNNLYVSTVISQSLIDADPHFAADVKAARQVLIQQFPQLSADITTEEFIAAARKALAPDGELPHTILVLDEVQQYVNEALDRSAAISEVAEAVQTQFDSRVMLVAAGQSALSAGTDSLLRLRDRFRITVELSDADVEAVTRKVLLRKKPSAVPELERLFEAHAGEVARHLHGTRVGPRSDDQRHRLDDYPLLCTRRRFWEACFQKADEAGTRSQLRSQLRILHDSLHHVAEDDLGAAIPASDLFNALAPDLVNTGVLLNEINTRIQKLDDGTEEGRLRRDLCGLAFLIGKLPRESGADLGLRADAATLADLTVKDITVDSGPFRKRVADALESLAADGVLMRLETEYRLQTAEGAEWDRAFRERQTSLRQSELVVTSRRDHLFGQELQAIVAATAIRHGESKQRRSVVLHAGNEPPALKGDSVVVWTRDGWSCALRDVEADARRLGTADATLHVHLPKRGEDQLRERLIEVEAARQVLDHYGTPSSDSGREARAGMESRRAAAEQARDEIVRDILQAARVFQGGGSEVYGDTLAAKIEQGAERSVARLFPRFAEGDHRGWDAAWRRAKDGADQPFKVVGWDGPIEDHPVGREVLASVGTGSSGTVVHRALGGPPYGWPREAIDAALLALHRSGHLRVTRNGQPVPLGGLDQTAIKTAEFRPEKVRLATPERIALRGLFDKAGVRTKSGEEEIRAHEFLAELRKLAARAGGAPPLPPAPDTTRVEDLARMAGSEQLGAIHGCRDELEAAISEWTALADRAAIRLRAWDLTKALLRHAEGLSIHGEVASEVAALERQRSLLDVTDPVAPLAARITAALRAALTALHGRLDEAVAQAVATLERDATWAKLDEPARVAICRHVGLEPPHPLAMGTDDALRHVLDQRSLPAWQAAIDAVTERTAKALAEAAAQVASRDPDNAALVVSIRRGTLADKDAVRRWLDEHEVKLMEAAGKGPVIVR